jgi:hypothetical protein
MRLFPLIAAMFTVLLTCGVAVGRSDTGDNIMPGCRVVIEGVPANLDKELARKIGDCIHIVAVTLSTTHGFCLPASVTSAPQGTLDQVIRAVVKYVDERPMRLHEDFHTLALEAFRATWPCN